MKLKIEFPFNEEFDKAYKYYNSKRKRYYVRLYSTKDGSSFTTTYARYLMSVKLGYIVPSNLHVDHIDENSINDDIDNFQLLTIPEHYKKTSPYLSNQILTDQQVRQIKFLSLFTDLTQLEIANLYDTTDSNICLILNGKRRKNIKLDLNNKLQINSLKCVFKQYLRKKLAS